MRARWLLVLVTAAVLVGTPVAIGARPVGASNVSAVELARLMQGSAGVAWSGYVETSGTGLSFVDLYRDPSCGGT